MLRINKGCEEGFSELNGTQAHTFVRYVYLALREKGV